MKFRLFLSVFALVACMSVGLAVDVESSHETVKTSSEVVLSQADAQVFTIDGASFENQILNDYMIVTISDDGSYPVASYSEVVFHLIYEVEMETRGPPGDRSKNSTH